ncbi:hypothetical protein LP420_39530 [Massilia sp. B-10]|nr:hypothetical protein LP420_39530 [Massilia sp. B-10]
MMRTATRREDLKPHPARDQGPGHRHAGDRWRAANPAAGHAVQRGSELDPVRLRHCLSALVAFTGSLYVLAARLVQQTRYRLMIGAVLAILFMLTWVELAVGIFGTRFA